MKPKTVRMTCTFNGRLNGAIGVFYDHTIVVEIPASPAATRTERARLACYETHDHITGFRAEVSQ